MADTWTEKLEAIMAPFGDDVITRSKGSMTGKGYDTTGIKIQALVDRMNALFGFGAFQMEGIKFTEYPETKTRNGRTMYHRKVEFLFHFFLGETEVTYPVMGGHSSATPWDAEKGAITSAMKKGFSFISLGNQAYLGTLDDDDTPGDHYGPKTAVHPTLWDEAKPLFKAIGINTPSGVTEYSGKKWPELSEDEQRDVIERIKADIAALPADGETGEVSTPDTPTESPAPTEAKEVTFDDLKPLCKELGLTRPSEVNLYCKLRFDGKTVSKLKPEDLSEFKGILETMIESGERFDIDEMKRRLEAGETASAGAAANDALNAAISGDNPPVEKTPETTEDPANWAEQVADMEKRIKEMFGGEDEFIQNFKKAHGIAGEKPSPQAITAACKAIADVEDNPDKAMDYM